MHFAVDLGSDNNLVPLCEVLQRASEDLLTPSNGIHVGGIEEIDPQFEGVLDDRSAVLLVQHPLMDPAGCVPESHAPQANT